MTASSRSHTDTRYRTIVADPPWQTAEGRTAPSSSWGKPRAGRVPYETMTQDEIAALPVGDLAADEAHIYVWTTNTYLETAYSLVRAWGFRTAQVLVWVKSPRGIGLGGAFTNTTEFVLFGWRGKCDPKTRVDSSWFHWPRGAHSVKPEAFLDLVEQVSPGPYLELFARRQRLGWDTWGNEALEHVSLDV